MADTKITGYAALGAAPASGDLVEIVDVSDTSMSVTGTNKKITTANLAGYMYGTAGTFTAAQTAQITDAGTTTVVYPLIVDHQSSGTPANGIGSGIAFDVETAAANTERGATIEAVTTDVTAASEDFEIAFKTMVNGAAAADRVRIAGGQMLSYSNGTETLPAYAFDISGNRAYGMWYSGGSLIFSINGTRAVTVTLGTLEGNASAFRGYKHYVVARTSDATETSAATNNTLGYVTTNEGATALVTRTLPSAFHGFVYRFACADADGIKIVAGAGAEIRVIDKVTAAAGYIQSTTIGSYVELVAINTTTWLATTIHGVWTDGTFTYDDTSLTTP